MKKNGEHSQEVRDEAQLAHLLNDVSIDQILAMDTELRVIAWNKACEQVTGISKAKAIGSFLCELLPEAAALPDMREAVKVALSGFKSFVPWDKGSYGGGYFENHFIPLREEGSEGQVTGVLNIIHDVAHRIKAEKDLQALNRALEFKNKELKQKTEELANFNYIVSHDLKEPLRKIYIFIEMVAMEEHAKLSDASRSNLRRAQSAVQRMGMLTDDLITFSEVTAPRERLTEINLRHAFLFARHQLQKTIDESGAIIETETLPTIFSYQDLMEHLWNQMLSNALKFHVEGSTPQVQIGYRYVSGKDIAVPEADAGAQYHCISFKDNGIGFDPVYSEKIFGMFQRLHTEQHYKGTGMGLAICRRIAEAHEGFITVESAEGKGSTFFCYLKELGPVQE